METKLRVAWIVCAMLLPVMALAATPNITGTNAEYTGGEVHVSWDAVSTASMSHYRVYYSGKSILDNDGVFDDFEITDGPESSISFTPPPDADALFVAVIGVAEDQTESEFFIEEASVQISKEENDGKGEKETKKGESKIEKDTPKMEKDTGGSGGTGEKENALPPQLEPPVPAGPVQLLKGEVKSPTQIITTFSAPITVAKEKAPEALKITDPKGNNLHINSITIKGKTITINTEEQTKGAVYKVQYSEPFEGTNGQKLDEDNRSVLITGHADGKEKTVEPVQERSPYFPPDVANVVITPQIQQNTAYHLTVNWELDNTPQDIAYVLVYQTRDGQNFAQPSVLPANVGGVELGNVTPGFFGLYIQTVNVYGYVSQGTFQYVTLPQYVPGQGFYGQLTFGTMDSPEEADFEVVEEEDSLPEIAVMNENTETHEISNDIIASSAPTKLQINWVNASILAGGILFVLFIVISAFSVAQKKSSVAG